MTDDTLVTEPTQVEQPAGKTTAVPAAAEPAAAADDPAAATARLTAERDEYLENLQRLQAEFDNFRKRARRDQDAAFDRAVVSVVNHLLPVFDAIDAARTHYPGLEDAIGGALHPALVSLGVTRIEPLGEPFDPLLAEGVATDTTEADQGEPPAAGSVVEVLRPGYRCRDRLIRPAMVRVAGPRE